MDQDLKHRVDDLVNELENSDRIYSDIDLIVEKRISNKRSVREDVLNEEQLADLFGSLKEQEIKKKEGGEEKKEAPKKVEAG